MPWAATSPEHPHTAPGEVVMNSAAPGGGGAARHKHRRRRRHTTMEAGTDEPVQVDGPAADVVAAAAALEDGGGTPSHTEAAGPGVRAHMDPRAGAELRQRRRVGTREPEHAESPAHAPALSWRERTEEYCRERRPLYWLYVLVREQDETTVVRNTHAASRALRCLLFVMVLVLAASFGAFTLRHTLLYRVVYGYERLRDDVRTQVDELWQAGADVVSDTTEQAGALVDRVEDAVDRVRPPSVLARWLPAHWLSAETADAPPAYAQPQFADWAAFRAHAGGAGCLPHAETDRGTLLEQLREHFAEGTRPTPASPHRFVTGPLLSAAGRAPFVCACTVDVRAADGLGRETLTWLDPRLTDVSRGCVNARECASDYYEVRVTRPPVLRHYGAVHADETLPYSITVAGTLVRRDPPQASPELYPYVLEPDTERTFTDVQDMVSLKYCLRFLPEHVAGGSPPHETSA